MVNMHINTYLQKSFYMNKNEIEDKLVMLKLDLAKLEASLVGKESCCSIGDKNTYERIAKIKLRIKENTGKLNTPKEKKLNYVQSLGMGI